MPVGLVHSAAARALGWALIHFLWEGAALAALLAAILFLGRPLSAKLRYGLACVAMAAMLAAFVITLAILWPEPPVTITLQPAMRFAVPVATLPVTPPPPAPVDRLSWIVPFWMAGVLIFYMRTAGGWLAAQRLRGKAARPASPEWQERLRALAARLRVMRPVALLESSLAESPVMMGFLRPVILVPAGLLAGLAPDQLEAILLHELAHIRRHDYAVNVLQSLVEGLLFYHPAVWWVSGVVRAERENCCDDAVVAVRGDARGYAEALAALESMRSTGQPALAAKGGNLMKRIHRLLEPERPRSAVGPVLAAVLLITPVAWGLAAWQTPPPVRLANRAATPTERLDQIGTNRSLSVEASPVRLRGLAASPSPDDGQLNAQSSFPLYAQAATPNQQQQREAEYRDFLLFYPAEAQLRAELATPYRKWLIEDVAYIIADEERQAFLKLQTDEEREHFIEQFWLRRDPTPGTVENEFKEEHYRRIAYANDHFACGIPGWKTDRGRIYIQYGPPDEIDDHSAAAAPELPYQRWRYRQIKAYDPVTKVLNIYQNVTFEFTDPTRSGEYRMTQSPIGQADASGTQRFARILALQQPPATPESDRDAEIRILTRNYQAANHANSPVNSSPLAVDFEITPGAQPNESLLTIYVPVNSVKGFNIFGRVTTSSKRRVQTFEDTVENPGAGVYRKTVSLGPGSYRLDVVMKDLGTNETTQGGRDIQIDAPGSQKATLTFLEAQLAEARTRLAEARESNAPNPATIRSLEQQVQLLEKELNFVRVKVATPQPSVNGGAKK